MINCRIVVLAANEGTPLRKAISEHTIRELKRIGGVSSFEVCSEDWSNDRPKGLWDFFKRHSNEHYNDLLIIEDDVQPCLNAVLRAATQAIPDGAGILSFFRMNFENGNFNGSQAFKISASAMRRLPATPPHGGGWDVALGMAMAGLGLRVDYFKPSLFQHIGIESIATPGAMLSNRRIAIDFPGIRWDAMQ